MNQNGGRIVSGPKDTTTRWPPTVLTSERDEEAKEINDTKQKITSETVTDGCGERRHFETGACKEETRQLQNFVSASICLFTRSSYHYPNAIPGFVGV